MKEKADLKQALEKALADLKNSSSNSSGVLQENEDLRNKLDEAQKKLTDTESELEILREQILSKVEETLKIEKDKLFSDEQLGKMGQNYKEAKEELDILQEQLIKMELKLKAEISKNDKYRSATKDIASVHEKMKHSFKPIESTLSCLSCLEYLSEPDPLTLVCGHSICKKCFNMHSDPNS